MKLNTWNHETVVEGNIYDGPDADDWHGQPRRAEAYRVTWTAQANRNEGERSVEVHVSGRRVTKAGTIHKRDSFRYSIHSRALEQRVLKMLWEAGEVPDEIWQAYLVERGR